MFLRFSTVRPIRIHIRESIWPKWVHGSAGVLNNDGMLVPDWPKSQLWPDLCGTLMWKLYRILLHLQHRFESVSNLTGSQLSITEPKLSLGLAWPTARRQECPVPSGPWGHGACKGINCQVFCQWLLYPGWTLKVSYLFNVSPLPIPMPYSVGLQSAATAFLSSGFAIQFTVAVVIFLVIISVISVPQEVVDAPKSLPGYSLFHIAPFFRKRYDFLNWGFHATGQNIFQLNLLRVRLHYFILGSIHLYFSVEHSYCCFWRECKTDFFYSQGLGFNRRLQNPFWSCKYFVL